MESAGSGMSRYTIEQGHGIEVVVGWDDPLGSYFAQVFEEASADLVASLDGRVTSLLVLSTWLKDEHGVDLPGDAASSLISDKGGHNEWRPGPLQAALGFTGVQETGGAVAAAGNVYSDAEDGL